MIQIIPIKLIFCVGKTKDKIIGNDLIFYLDQSWGDLPHLWAKSSNTTKYIISDIEKHLLQRTGNKKCKSTHVSFPI